MTTDDALAMISDGERRMVMEQVMEQIQRYLQYRAERNGDGSGRFLQCIRNIGKTNLADVL